MRGTSDPATRRPGSGDLRAIGPGSLQPGASEHPIVRARLGRSLSGIEPCVTGFGIGCLKIIHGGTPTQATRQGYSWLLASGAGHPGLGLSDVAQPLRLDVAPGGGTSVSKLTATVSAP